jgi:hypothetical protein
MTLEQFSAFVTVLPRIEGVLSDKGESLPRPQYDAGGPVRTSTADEDDDDSDDADEKKANFDATSDEDDD